MDRPAQRVLDRNDGRVGRPLRGGLEGSLEGAAGERVAPREGSEGSCLGVGARDALVGDARARTRGGRGEERGGGRGCRRRGWGRRRRRRKRWRRCCCCWCRSGRGSGSRRCRSSCCSLCCSPPSSVSASPRCCAAKATKVGGAAHQSAEEDGRGGGGGCKGAAVVVVTVDVAGDVVVVVVEAAPSALSSADVDTARTEGKSAPLCLRSGTEPARRASEARLHGVIDAALAAAAVATTTAVVEFDVEAALPDAARCLRPAAAVLPTGGDESSADIGI